MKARATYDPDADAIGVYFADDGAVYDASEEVLPGITLDFDSTGRVIGLEIAGVQRLLRDGELPTATVDTADRPAAD